MLLILSSSLMMKQFLLGITILINKLYPSGTGEIKKRFYTLK